jgi:uncharacterized membrane protein YgcG
MPKMIGTGKDPLGRYSEGLVFDLEDNDPEMVQDFIDKGWANLLDEREHPGRTRTQIAAAMVRGDALADPVEQEIADEIGDDAHAIVHLEDPDATQSDYETETQKGPAGRQREVARQIPADYEGGVPNYGKSGGARGSRSSGGSSSSSGTTEKASGGGGGSSSGGSSGSAEKQPGGAAKS